MKDPAFLFYDGDAAKDVSHMNRLERGCYFDLIQAQRKFGRLSESLIHKILGKDFDNCWESIKICLTYDNDMYFIEWLENSTIKRKEYSESRRKNRLKQQQEENQSDNTHIENNICKSYDKHMVNENENINKDLINNKKNQIKNICMDKTESVLIAFEKWRDYLIKQHNVYMQENEYTYDVLIDALKRINPDKVVEAIDYSIVSRFKKIYEQKEYSSIENKTKSNHKNVNDKWIEKKRKLGIEG